MIGNGMASGEQPISLQEIRFAINIMRANKATDETVLLQKLLEIEDVDKLRGLMNGILNGAAKRV